MHLDRKEKWNHNEGRKSGVTNKEEHSKADKARGKDGYVQMDFALRSIILNFWASFFYHLGLPALL